MRIVLFSVRSVRGQIKWDFIIWGNAVWSGANREICMASPYSALCYYNGLFSFQETLRVIVSEYV